MTKLIEKYGGDPEQFLKPAPAWPRPARVSIARPTGPHRPSEEMSCFEVPWSDYAPALWKGLQLDPRCTP